MTGARRKVLDSSLAMLGGYRYALGNDRFVHVFSWPQKLREAGIGHANFATAFCGLAVFHTRAKVEPPEAPEGFNDVFCYACITEMVEAAENR